MADNLYYNTSAADNLNKSALEADPTIATPDHVKNNHLYKDTTSREIKVGTMPIIPPESVKIDPEEIGKSVYRIPKGYHDGTGEVHTGSLSEYTPGNASPEDVVNNKVFWVNGEKRIGSLDIEQAEQIATATSEDIIDGKTAWVNGKKITGSIPRLPRRDKTLLSEESYTIPYGLSAGTSIITAASLKSQTPATATGVDIIKGKSAWVNGEKIDGTLNIDNEMKKRLSDTDAMQYQVLSGKKFYSSMYGQVVSGRMVDHSGEPPREIEIGENFFIPSGYYSGYTRVHTKTLEDSTVGSAHPEHIVATKEAWVNGKKVVGTMPANSPKEIHLDPGEVFNIPEGYHSGSGSVSANSIEDITAGTAKDFEIAEGKSAWVNGKRIVGTMETHKEYSVDLEPGTTKYVPKGYHDGSGSVSVKPLSSFTPGTADPNQIINGKVAWVNGEKITGSMPINNRIDVELKAGEFFDIPTGYHPDTSLVKAASLESQTVGDAAPDDVIKGKTTWVNGNEITGTLELTGDADAGDVIAGATFYSNDPKNKNTGTLVFSGNASEDDVLDGVSFYSTDPKRKRFGSIKLTGTSNPDEVLAGTYYYKDNPKSKIEGTMPNIGQIHKRVNFNEVFTIPRGYHDGTGTVTTENLDIQTPGDAVPGDIIKTKTAWVNGDKITGTLELTGDATPEKVVAGVTFYNHNAKKKLTGTMVKNISSIVGVDCGQEYIIPPGYHDGTGKVFGKSLESQTQADSSSSDILMGHTAWVNGIKVSGIMPDHANRSFDEVLAGDVITIPKGFYNGLGTINAKDLASQTIADATENDILAPKSAWVNGEKIIGIIPTKNIKMVRVTAGNELVIPAGYYPDGVKIYSLYTDRLDLTGTDAEVIVDVLYPHSTGYVDGDTLVVTVDQISTV